MFPKLVKVEIQRLPRYRTKLLDSFVQVTIQIEIDQCLGGFFFKPNFADEEVGTGLGLRLYSVLCGRTVRWGSDL